MTKKYLILKVKLVIKVFRKVVFRRFVISVFVTSYESSSAEKILKLNPVDLVYPQLDSENSRWFFFSSACRPFGMVNLSSDTEIDGALRSGYLYKTDTIKGFSHIYAWELSGLSVMPATISNDNRENVFTDFYSPFSHEIEKVSPGYQIS